MVLEICSGRFKFILVFHQDASGGLLDFVDLHQVSGYIH